MRVLKHIWEAFLSFFSGLFTVLLNKKKQRKKVKLSRIKNTEISGNYSKTDLTIKNTKNSQIINNEFYYASETI